MIRLPFFEIKEDPVLKRIRETVKVNANKSQNWPLVPYFRNQLLVDLLEIIWLINLINEIHDQIPLGRHPYLASLISVYKAVKWLLMTHKPNPQQSVGVTRKDSLTPLRVRIVRPEKLQDFARKFCKKSFHHLSPFQKYTRYLTELQSRVSRDEGDSCYTFW